MKNDSLMITKNEYTCNDDNDDEDYLLISSGINAAIR